MQAKIDESGEKLTLEIPINKKGELSKSGKSQIHYMTEIGKWDTLSASLNGKTLNAKVTIAAFEPRAPKKPDTHENDGGI